MVKVIIERDEDGFITKVTQDFNGEEIEQSILSQIILNVTKLDNNVISYHYSFELDSDGYIISAGTSVEGNVVLTAEQANGIAYGATKLVDGKLIVDDDKLKELGNVSEPLSEQEQINKDLTDQLATAQQQNSELQSALLELSDIVLSGGLS